MVTQEYLEGMQGIAFCPQLQHTHLKNKRKSSYPVRPEKLHKMFSVYFMSMATIYGFYFLQCCTVDSICYGDIWNHI